MRIKLNVVDEEFGVLSLKTSDSQMSRAGDLRDRLYKMVDVLIKEAEEAVRENGTTYIDKTVRIGRRVLND